MEERKYRMYGLVPYNISPIQQGIQFGHAVVEYGLIYGETPEYQRWAREDKTFIILNGGTTNTSSETPGSLNQYVSSLRMLGMKIATFHEPDLGDQLTAGVFLVDDRVWDKETWPDYEEILGEDDVKTFSLWRSRFSEDGKEASHIIFLRNFLKTFRLA